ncbi:AAA family ATPase [Solwaraspora sp. WMMD1047]|uniref:AAA family ATPase n=1 Tax=Solwaraspora sp. WMMD1047 TaxID=3016102 RepID=UPI0024177095|nr:AAA family ATPase [Solwaraspora sp. WMMD1047]MDG4834179.1 AAA family ATPase [Solwaraspora sp. WMMD1047]
MNPTSPQPANPGANPTPTPAAPATARRIGHLYPRVAQFLADNPDNPLKVGQITRAIGAPSSGAVFGVLKRMASVGYATHVRDPYHRFQITPAGIAAAGTLPPPAPRGASGGGRAGRSGRRKPVTRPNGELYWPRKLAGGTDIEVLRRLRAAQMPVLLYGPPGTGKTAMVEAAFDDLLTVAGTGDTVVEDFLGNYVPLPDGGYEFVYGPLVQAMRDGRPLLVDDATLIPPRVLSVLYPAMDGRRVIHLTAYRNERVEATDGFYVIAGHNPGVHGAVLTEALASRFGVHIEVTTDWDLARRLKVDNRAVAAAIDLNNELAAGTVTWAPQLRELLGFARLHKTLSLATAVSNLAGRAPDHDRDAVIKALTTHFGTTVTALSLGPQH